MSAEIRKEYTNGELTVIWKPGLCIHAKECIKALPNVYDPTKRPWITPEHATTAQLKAQIKTCPSGALTYSMAGEEEIENSEQNKTMETKVEVLKNGPLMVHGTLAVTDASGKTESKKRATAFCRCGASSNKPYCDGAHNGIDFKG